jgi:hypothetical protein
MSKLMNAINYAKFGIVMADTIMTIKDLVEEAKEKGQIPNYEEIADELEFAARQVKKNFDISMSQKKLKKCVSAFVLIMEEDEEDDTE